VPEVLKACLYDVGEIGFCGAEVRPTVGHVIILTRIPDTLCPDCAVAPKTRRPAQRTSATILPLVFD
jgi:hypothetical protein